MILAGVPVRPDRVQLLASLLEGDELAAKLERALEHHNKIVSLTQADRGRIVSVLDEAPGTLGELRNELVKQHARLKERDRRDENLRERQRLSASRRWRRAPHPHSDTTADVTEGNRWPIVGLVWDSLRYDWSQPGALTATVESNLFKSGAARQPRELRHPVGHFQLRRLRRSSPFSVETSARKPSHFRSNAEPVAVGIAPGRTSIARSTAAASDADSRCR